MASSSLHISVCPSLLKIMRHPPLLCFFVRHYTKKYNYNLNELIDWKQKTNLAFGSPRKPTKTGKLRKSKNKKIDKLNETLESMSAMSSFYGSQKLKKYEQFSENTSDDKDFHYISETAKEESSQLPFQCFTEDVEHSTKEKTDRYFKKDIQEKQSKNESNDIIIPVISPVPDGNSMKNLKIHDQVTKSKLSKSSVNQFKSKFLPSEPPVSFELINQVPLTGIEHLLDKEMDFKIQEFKGDVESMSLRKPPSVKSILNKTMPDLNRFFLNRWREKMIQELGEEGFKIQQDATIKRGVNLHANVMELLSGKSTADIQVMPDNEGHWASLQTAMKHISGVKALEEDLNHPVLMYRGIMDCVAKYRDVLCVIDWKTSKKPRPLLKNTYDDPVQVAAYMGLINASQEKVSQFGEVRHGLLVIIYPDGSPAHIHLMNELQCEQYWHDWCDRLYNYYQLTYTEKFGSEVKTSTSV